MIEIDTLQRALRDSLTFTWKMVVPQTMVVKKETVEQEMW